jgi:hypothetical protein
MIHDTPAARAVITRCLCAIDPQLDKPIYVVFLGEVAELVGLSQYTRALTSPRMSGELSERLQKMGLWQGPGFCTVVDEAHFENYEQLLATSIHEFSHYFDNQKIRDNFISVLGADKFEEYISTPLAPGKIVDDVDPLATLKPWDRHTPTHARLCIHAGYRAMKLGWYGSYSQIFNGLNYLLPPGDDFAFALGAEPQRLADLPMSDVAKTEPPEQFKQFASSALAAAEVKLNQIAAIVEETRKEIEKCLTFSQFCENATTTPPPKIENDG